MRRGIYLPLVVALACMAPGLYGQDQKAEIQKRLTSQFTVTKMTADASDVIKAGSVLVLHKNGLMLCSTLATTPPTNTYKNGAISFGFKSQMAWGLALGAAGQQSDAIPQRKFVDGEKFWVTAFSVQNDGVVLQFYSDPFDNIRYYGQLKFPFQKGAAPPADDMMKTIAEVVTVDNSQDAQSSDAPAEATGTASSGDGVQAAPVTIALDQTKDQVVAILGQPQKIASLGAKEIYYYKDMKVTFVDGKVKDVQ